MRGRGRAAADLPPLPPLASPVPPVVALTGSWGLPAAPSRGESVSLVDWSYERANDLRAGSWPGRPMLAAPEHALGPPLRSGDGRAAALGEQVVEGLAQEFLDGGVLLGGEDAELALDLDGEVARHEAQSGARARPWHGGGGVRRASWA